jgi:hypothetical protein
MSMSWSSASNAWSVRDMLLPENESDLLFSQITRCEELLETELPARTRNHITQTLLPLLREQYVQALRSEARCPCGYSYPKGYYE